jgi:oligopeptide/dipeptide ABC transporter ATP-binding protein
LLPENGQITNGSITLHTGGGAQQMDSLEQYGKRMRSIRGGQIGMIFQDTLSALNPAHRVGRQVAENLRQHTDISKSDARKKVVEIFRRLGIPDPERRYDAYPHEFSGGMRQRVMIAMAMICNPDLIIADEPTTALDVTIQAQIMELLKELQQQEHKSFVLITHNMGLVSEVADFVAVMYLGRIVEYGTAAQVLENPQHPYTVALLQSVPSVGMDRSAELRTVAGQTPSPAEVVDGCEFATRCPFVSDRCRTGVIRFRTADDGHPVRCVLLGQLLHFGQNLRLDGDVQRGGRFVGDDEVRPVQHGNGNGHALAHAAGQLMRVGQQAFLGAGNAHHAQRVACQDAGLGAAHLVMRAHRLDHLHVHPQHGVQRHHRILEDHGDAVALQAAQFARGQRGQVAALEQGLAAHDAARRIDQTHDGKARDGLARAGFTDQAQDLAAFQLKRDAIHGGQHARAGMELRAQVAHFKRGRRASRGRAVGHLWVLGFSTSRRRSPTRLIATMVMSSAMPG